MTTQPLVPARYYARLLELPAIRAQLPEVLAACRLDAAQLTEPDAQLRLSQLEELLAYVTRLPEGATLALTLGKQLKLSSHQILGYAMMSSPHVEYALKLAARYFSSLILPPFRMTYLRDARHVTLSFSPTTSMSHTCLVFNLEAIASALHCELREMLGGSLPPYDVHFSFDRPAHADAYADLRGVRPHFASLSSPGLVTELPASVALHPLMFSDNAALRMAEERCKGLAHSVAHSGQVSDWVLMMLRESNNGLVSLDELARTLNMSARTLDRWLKKEGAGFRQLRQAVCRDKSLALLADPDRSVTGIAHELGYADVANFTRAFRQFQGMSPQHYRSSLSTQNVRK